MPEVEQLLRAALSRKDKEVSRKTVSEYATKFSYKELVTMYQTNQISNMFKRVIKAKLKRGSQIPDEKRIQIYRNLGLVNFQKANNPNYYRSLLELPNYPQYFESTIEKDVLRTIPSIDQGIQAKERFHNALRNILLAMCRRNPHIGYCQGFNYIVSYFLELRMDEEETFYITIHLIENIIPPDYYNSMTGVLCDDKLLDYLIRIKLPRLKNKMVEMGIQTSVFSVQWLVCLFTFFGFNKRIASTIMDYLLAFGSDSLLQATITHLELAEEQLLAMDDLGVFLMCLENRMQKFEDVGQFMEKMNQNKMSKQLLDQARNLVRQAILDEKLKSDINFLPKKQVQLSQLLTLRCNPAFPICLYAKEKSKIDKEYFDSFVFKVVEINIIDNFYMTKQPHQRPKQSLPKYTEQNILIGRDFHQCAQQMLHLDQGTMGETWHSNLGDIKYAQYLNINEKIDYGRDSYLFINTPPVQSLINSRVKTQTQEQPSTQNRPINKNRSPLKEFLLLPVRLLNPRTTESPAPKPQPVLRDRSSVSPRLIARRGPIWQPLKETAKIKKRQNKGVSPSIQSTEAQSQQDQSNMEQVEKLKKLSVILGQDEVLKIDLLKRTLQHSSSIRFLADLVVGNDQLQDIFTRPHSPSSKQISRRQSGVFHQ